MAVGQEGPWHSVNADIYHDNPNCQTGSSIDPENIRRGNGSLEHRVSLRLVQLPVTPLPRPVGRLWQ